MRLIQCLFLVVPLFLSACGGGKDNGAVAEERPEGQISGTAFDGLIIGGTVEVYEFTDATKGQLLATGETNATGQYSINLSVPSQPVLIEIYDGYYIEESSGIQVEVDRSLGHKIYAVENYVSGSNLEVSATFFTTIATGLAEYYVNEYGYTAEIAIEKAYREVDAWAGFDVRATVPVDVSRIINNTPYRTNSHDYGFVAAGISLLSLEVGNAIGSDAHDEFPSIGFISMSYEDAKFDGVPNGQGSTGQLSFGGLAINSNTYRELLSKRMMQFVVSNRNKTGLDFDDMLPFASTINSYSGDLFSNVEAPNITEIEPTVSQLIPSEGEVIAGTYVFSVLADDPFGIESIDYYVGDQFVGSASSEDTSENVNTFNFENGNYEIRAEVTNFLGNTTTVTHMVTIYNGELSLSLPDEWVRARMESDEADNNFPVSCDIPIRVSDTTGQGVHFLRVNGATILYNDPISDGSKTVTYLHPWMSNSCTSYAVEAEDRFGTFFYLQFRVGQSTSGSGSCHIQIGQCGGGFPRPF